MPVVAKTVTSIWGDASVAAPDTVTAIEYARRSADNATFYTQQAALSTGLAVAQGLATQLERTLTVQALQNARDNLMLANEGIAEAYRAVTQILATRITLP